ncbi:MAG: hypothetical protein ISS56_05250 [Anaerolineae bacterium]|nr:hypothetical protein [Anaerolineae bacterium]
METRLEKERALIRELARRKAELAASPENEGIRQRWRDVNALRRPDRAPVWCRPVGAWAEILPEEALACQDPWLRSIERDLHRTLIKHDIGDDSPVDGSYPVHAVLVPDPPNVWGVDVRRRRPDGVGGAWAYDPPLREERDFGRLVLPRFSFDALKTEEALSRAHGLLGDILPVEQVCDPPLGATLCTPAAELRGLSQLMIDLIASPHLVHRLMAYLRDAVLQGMDDVEAAGLLTPNNRGPMTCSDPVGSPPADGRLTCQNLWAMTNSQELDGVSPRMWETFYLDYQRPILERFGLVGYGCCENLTHKMEGVLSIPNLRIFVCSAWTDLARVVDRVGTDYVIMWRQKASDVVFPDDVGTIRRELEEGMRTLRGCHVQIVLRELQTLAGHPDRLHVWTRLAVEAATKFA